ncbi:right-handed parallel beta-helix repeat-containing protein [Demequina sediminicola]|uniref:right-handed parallel beta-helix repeat-containing protein n=1 Tax=Demequina sediminicola TaxID=1095026 RepID=UPI000783AAC8|nr:right-handed parallel beta-helix repeat-containing protein [Demequina sediminicola]
MVSEYHVATSGNDSHPGTADAPWKTISRAAQKADAGDTVVVHEGVYREWVKPQRSGRGEARRITYTAAPGERVVIKGSEVVEAWTSLGSGAWTTQVPAAVFGDFNPFAVEVEGDWAIYPSPDSPRRHLGDVYLDGKSLYEADSVDEVLHPVDKAEAVDGWSGISVARPDAAATERTWFAEVAEDCTTIWANFGDADPNAHLTEINVRRSVFAPVEHHIDYITVRGFELAQAASPWAPPTADQPGLIGPNWAKGWIIEDNEIHDAKCVAISLGKEGSTGHHRASERQDKPGYIYQIESVFAALRIGWDRENIGSHIVRRNHIFDCGQAGIVGHLGCAFSTIEDNHIERIALKREFFGHEIAGIKFHGAVDTVIEHNRINDCTLGIWLDWQTQGTRVSRNLLYRNTRDLFIEVAHGPHLVDHNVLGSPAALEVVCQGGAYVNNLIAGTVRLEPVMERPTPYHVPHSTQVAGYAGTSGGDDRFIANVFLAGDKTDAYTPGTFQYDQASYGTAGYDGCEPSMEKFIESLNIGNSDHEHFHGVRRPVQIERNVYASGAHAYEHETGATSVGGDSMCGFAIEERGDAVYLTFALPAGFADATGPVTHGTDLRPAYYPDAEFENPDGTSAECDVDLTGVEKSHDDTYPAGPLAELREGAAEYRVW